MTNNDTGYLDMYVYYYSIVTILAISIKTIFKKVIHVLYRNRKKVKQENKTLKRP